MPRSPDPELARAVLGLHRFPHLRRDDLRHRIGHYHSVTLGPAHLATLLADLAVPRLRVDERAFVNRVAKDRPDSALRPRHRPDAAIRDGNRDPSGVERRRDRAKPMPAKVLVKFPGLSFAVKPFLTERIEETVSGTTAQVVIKIFGDDLDALDQKAQEVAQVLSRVRGASEVQVPSPPGVPQMIVRLRRDRLTQLGFRPVDVLDAIQTGYQGVPVAQTFDGNRVFDVTVILDRATRRDPEALRSLVLRNPEGTRMPLRELAEVYPTTGRYVVLHDGVRRLQLVTCNVAGRDVASFVDEARRKIGRDVVFPAGSFPVFSGAAEAQAQSRQQLLIHSAIAGVGIVLLLAVVVGTARNLLLVLANLPFALIGGVLAVFMTGGWLSVGSLVGFITLFGITTRNSILLISHYEHLVTREGQRGGVETAVRGASERLVPILMTALVTALGLLPLAISSGTSGQEIEGPMAIVILGGLLTSTALNLLVLPSFALRYGRFEPATLIPDDDHGAPVSVPTH
jgi:Cu/Ag efflux pump CusA